VGVVAAALFCWVPRVPCLLPCKLRPSLHALSNSRFTVRKHPVDGYIREQKKVVTNPTGRNQYTKEQSAENEHQPKTAEKIAEEEKVSRETVTAFSPADPGKR